jgi:hypothetical protein
MRLRHLGPLEFSRGLREALSGRGLDLLLPPGAQGGGKEHLRRHMGPARRLELDSEADSVGDAVAQAVDHHGGGLGHEDLGTPPGLAALARAVHDVLGHHRR